MSVTKAQQSIREEMKALKAKMDDLKAKIISKTFADKLTVKIGEKGNLVVYGLGRFPVSLYSSQAARLAKLLNSTEFQEFVQENGEALAKKAE
jgi:D-arabinose 5-phosphate isomerase GutQ